MSSRILESDQKILACHPFDPTGSVLAESVRPEYRVKLGGIGRAAGGMAPTWGIRAFNLMQRLDEFSSKARYLSIGRDDNKGMIFLLNLNVGGQLGTES